MGGDGHLSNVDDHAGRGGFLLTAGLTIGGLRLGGGSH